jgi:cytoskeletal protein CcmA (bactofilin family)
MVFMRKPDPKPADTAPLPLRSVAAPPALEPPAPRASWDSHSASATESVIGSDLSIEGQTITIRTTGSLRVNGHVQADLHSMQLTVGEEGVISGSVAGETVEVYGKVHGAIRASRVVLHASAQVEGDIHSQFLSIEEGASFDGRSRKLSDSQEVTPKGATIATNGALVQVPPPIHEIPQPIQLS